MTSIHPSYSRWFTPLELTPSGRPKLIQDEVELVTISPTSWYDYNEEKLSLNTSITITSQRICVVFLDSSQSSFTYSCPLVALYSYRTEAKWFKSPKVFITLRDCSLDTTIKSDDDLTRTLAATPPSQPNMFGFAVNKPYEMQDILNYLDQGKKNAIKEFKNRITEQLNTARGHTHGSAVVKSDDAKRAQTIGISGILKRKEQDTMLTSATLQEASGDLTSLMEHAQKITIILARLAARQQANEKKKLSNNSNATKGPSSGPVLLRPNGDIDIYNNDDDGNTQCNGDTTPSSSPLPDNSGEPTTPPPIDDDVVISARDADDFISENMNDLDSIIASIGFVSPVANNSSTHDNNKHHKVVTFNHHKKSSLYNIPSDITIPFDINQLPISPFYSQLSLQLYDVVLSPLKLYRGAMQLVDLYCLYNKMRGTDLISPHDILYACQTWYINGIVSRSDGVQLVKMASGAWLIQANSHSTIQVKNDILSLLQNGTPSSSAAATTKTPYGEGFTAAALSQQLHLGLVLVTHYIDQLLLSGDIVKDISHYGTTYYINRFIEWV